MDLTDYLQSPALSRRGFAHAFFTRRGGVSVGPFASLNISLDVGDQSDHVAENCRRAARALGIAPEQLYLSRQVHGTDVLELGGAARRSVVACAAADAIIGDHAGLGCGVRTADCVPILLADAETGRVAAVHAGWRGVVGRIVVRVVERLIALGSHPASLVAAVGPHISMEAFEVGEDVAARVRAASSDPNVERRDAGTKPHVDLGLSVVAQLREAGLEAAAIDRVVGCTYRDASRFFSHRRDGAATGRLLSAIVAREPDARKRIGASAAATAKPSRRSSLGEP